MAGDNGLVQVEVVGVRTHVGDDETVVLLLDPESGLLVPILIGQAEASAIATSQAGIVLFTGNSDPTGPVAIAMPEAAFTV